MPRPCVRLKWRRHHESVLVAGRHLYEPALAFGGIAVSRLSPLAGILVFLAIWEVGVLVFSVPAYLMPPPTAVFRMFVQEFPKLMYHG